MPDPADNEITKQYIFQSKYVYISSKLFEFFYYLKIYKQDLIIFHSVDILWKIKQRRANYFFFGAWN